MSLIIPPVPRESESLLQSSKLEYTRMFGKDDRGVPDIA